VDTAIIIQARMSSRRFPGKVLFEVKKKPLLGYIIESLTNCKNSFKIIVATSNHKSDNSIVEYCKSKKIDYYRGPLNNVSQRFVEVNNNYKLKSFIRICADSPLIDYRLLDKFYNYYNQNHKDIVTNSLKETFPSGQGVEILNSNKFNKSFSLMRDDSDYEHVTKFFYDNEKIYDIYNFQLDSDYSNVRLCVDTKQDMSTFIDIIHKIEKPPWHYDLMELIEIYEEVKN
tara:strand:- start:9977 stop:10663 length:687 start_codon:yes stop_codon:yes gene_type:complete